MIDEMTFYSTNVILVIPTLNLHAILASWRWNATIVVANQHQSVLVEVMPGLLGYSNNIMIKY